MGTEGTGDTQIRGERAMYDQSTTIKQFLDVPIATETIDVTARQAVG